jgi:hypothetical protein
MNRSLEDTRKIVFMYRSPSLAYALVVISMALLAISASEAAQSNATEQSTPHIYVDRGACPFECCTYRQWTVKQRTALLDRPNGKRIIATLSKGEVVTGMTGEVISSPIAIKAGRDVPETPIKKGDTFYVLHYEGEGYWKVLFRGKTVDVHQSVINVPQPKTQWWVKIKDSHGVIGWALSHGNFAHQDACE